MHDTLRCTIGLLQKELHDCDERLKLDLIWLVDEAFKERGQKLFRVVDLVCILAENPDKGSFGFWLIKIFQIGAKCGYDSLVILGILSEDVLP